MAELDAYESGLMGGIRKYVAEGDHMAPTERVCGNLMVSGEQIVEDVTAETMLAEFCAANDVRVLVARRQPAP